MCVANVKTDIALEENNILFFHQTRLGNTAYTSYSDAAVASWYSYDEWGKPRTEYTNARHDLNQAGLDGVGQAYTGYTYDTVLELYYAQARFYDPDTRQFMTKDPARDGSLWYAYCAGNPVNRWDPSGLRYANDKILYSIQANVYIDYYTEKWEAADRAYRGAKLLVKSYPKNAKYARDVIIKKAICLVGFMMRMLGIKDMLTKI